MAEGFSPTALDPAPPLARTIYKRVSPQQVSEFTRQLSTLIGAGVPLLQSLHTIHQGMQSQTMGPVIRDLHAQVLVGLSLQAALEATGVFDPMYCQMVAAGELAGSLDEILNRLALQTDRQQLLRRKLTSALVYPAAVLLIAVAVVAVILIWVVPVFTSIFDAFGAQLPAPTRMIVNASSALVHWGLPMTIAGLLGVFALRQQYQRRPTWQWQWAVWSLRLPLLSNLIRHANLAMWTRCLAMLCQSGIALIDALEVVAGVCNNRVYASSCLDIRQAVLRGSSLATSLGLANEATAQQLQLFPSLLVQMIDIGEQSGTLTSLLSKAADTQENLLEQQLLGLTQLIEPALVVVLGGVVGGMVVALYLPVFQLGQVM